MLFPSSPAPFAFKTEKLKVFNVVGFGEGAGVGGVKGQGALTDGSRGRGAEPGRGRPLAPRHTALSCMGLGEGVCTNGQTRFEAKGLNLRLKFASDGLSLASEVEVRETVFLGLNEG